MAQRAGYQPAGLAAGVGRRWADLAELGSVAEELTDIDRRADELRRRAAELLAQQ